MNAVVIVCPFNLNDDILNTLRLGGCSGGEHCQGEQCANRCKKTFFHDAVTLVEDLDADVTEPYVVAVVLQSDVSFVVLTAAVVEQFECQG